METLTREEIKQKIIDTNLSLISSIGDVDKVEELRKEMNTLIEFYLKNK
jgi:hypothetical protein